MLPRKLFTVLRWKDSTSTTSSAVMPMPTWPARSIPTSLFVAPVPAPVLPEAFDPYIDPTTGILRNLVGATEQSQLDTLEAKLVTARGIQIVEPPVKVTNDLRQLRTIHQRLFQDVFPWAGELRTVDLRKRTPGAEHFMPVSRLQRGAGFAFAEFADEKYLRGLPKDQFVDRLAHHYDHVNTGGSALSG